MQITIGDTVRARDGELGKVERFLFEPRERKVEHIVVKHGFLVGSERAIPLDCISGTGDGVVNVDMDESAFKELPVWNPDLFRANQSDYVGPPGDDIEGTHQGDFLMDETVAIGSAGYMSAKPFGYPGGEQLVPDDKQAAEVAKGTDIVDIDDEKIGDVEAFSIDVVRRMPTRITMYRGMLLGHEIEIPIDWYDRALPGRVVLKVSKEQVESHAEAA